MPMIVGPTSITAIGQRLNWAVGRRIAWARCEIAERRAALRTSRRNGGALGFEASDFCFSLLDLASELRERAVQRWATSALRVTLSRDA